MLDNVKEIDKIKFVKEIEEECFKIDKKIESVL